MATAGVLGIASPAQADENGSEWCFLSTASISVKNAAGQPVTSVPYGTDLTVSWAVNPACPDFMVYMSGPGFGTSDVAAAGTRFHIWATPPAGSNSLTWSVGGIGVDASNPMFITLATRTVTVF